jgi:hypothetical protein
MRKNDFHSRTLFAFEHKRERERELEKGRERERERPERDIIIVTTNDWQNNLNVLLFCNNTFCYAIFNIFKYI